MRIGEFAEKHGITQDTIRYYLDMGLLATEKKVGQFKFTKADSEDMCKIIELKNLEFSLNDIQRILTFQRLSGTNTDVFRNLYKPYLESKKQEVLHEIDKYTRMAEYLNSKLTDMENEEQSIKKNLGFPLASVDILVCPYCKSPFEISNGSIEDNMILNADLRCDCGFKANIESGVYIHQDALREKMLNGKPIPTKEEFLAESSHRYINFMYKSMDTIIEQMKKFKPNPKYVLELDNCVGFFLLQYINDIPSDSTYILVDYDRSRMQRLKTNLELFYTHKKFIFLCCDFNMLPLAHSSVDIVVDHGLSKNHLESDGTFILKEMLPFLNNQGIVSGTYNYVDACAKSQSPQVLKRSSILKTLESNGFTPLELADIGPVKREAWDKSVVDNNDIFALAFIGEPSNK
ncbi:MAG: MerR family transcriptional regulator [Clostridiales bacterium]|nr:MerR family transcriptional regulator [Clostridiales bacterium]